MKELALEMKLRENDAAWKVRFDSLVNQSIVQHFLFFSPIYLFLRKKTK